MKRSKNKFTRASNRNLSKEEAKRKNQKRFNSTLARRRLFLAVAIVAAIAAGILVWLYTTGYFGPEADKTTMTFLDDGRVVFEEVEELKENASKKQIVSYAKESIREYNKSADTKSIRLVKCRVNEKRVYLKTIYNDLDSYCAFTKLSVFEGSVRHAQNEGYDFNASFVRIEGGKKGKPAKQEDIEADDTYKVIITDQPMVVDVPGELLFVSDESTGIKGHSVDISDAAETYIIFK